MFRRKISWKPTWFLCSLLILASLVTFTACDQDQREANITKVIKQVYEGPDQELLKQSLQEETVSALEESEFFTYIDSKYDGITTDQCYENLLRNRLPYKYHMYLEDRALDMKVIDIQVEEKKASVPSYDFTVTVEVKGEDNTEEQFDITGSAQYEKEGNQISFIQFNDSKLDQYVGQGQL